MSAQELTIVFDEVLPSSDPATSPNDIPVTDIATKISGDPTFAFEDLVGGESVVIGVTNLGTDTLYNVGLWIAPATISGAFDVRNHQSMQSDYLDVIKMGDSAIEAGGPQRVSDSDVLGASYEEGGLWVKSPSGDWYRVNSMRGVSRATRIGSITLASSDSVGWELFVDPPAGATAIRYYFDVMVEDGA